MLKFSGFGLSRVEGENLAELFQQFNDMAGDEWRHPEENPHNNTMGTWGLSLSLSLSLSLMLSLSLSHALSLSL